MRQYYLCNPANQAITGPHPLADLIRLSRDGAITPEWYVAEPGSESFLSLAESFSLNEILFNGGAVPVEPPPVAGARLKNSSARPAQAHAPSVIEPVDHHAEFTKVVEKSIRLQRSPLPPPRAKASPARDDEPLTPDNVILAAREDLQRVLQKHDEKHFNPPTYWQSPAGERMKNFLQAECWLLLSGLLFFAFMGICGLLTNFLMIALPIGLGLLTISFAYVFLFMQA